MLYGYSEYIPLTREEILKRVSEEDIFKIVIKQEVLLDRKSYYVAPYRNDEVPGCYFESYKNTLVFVDFADSESISKDCIKFISRTYNLSYSQALEFINNYFNLGLGNSSSIPIRELYNIQTEESHFKKVERTIIYKPRYFNLKDKQFWSKYEISRKQLEEDKVIPISIYLSQNRKGINFSVGDENIMYAYTEFESGRIKIYRPLEINEKSKWFTNCNQDDIGGLLSISDESDTLVISKSYKDCRVLRNQNVNTVWFQNEGMLPDRRVLQDKLSGYKRYIVWYDNDNAGLAASRKVVEYVQSVFPTAIVKSLFLPPILLKENIKDPSDLIANRGVNELKDFIKNNL